MFQMNYGASNFTDNVEGNGTVDRLATARSRRPGAIFFNKSREATLTAWLSVVYLCVYTSGQSVNKNPTMKHVIVKALLILKNCSIGIMLKIV